MVLFRMKHGTFAVVRVPQVAGAPNLEPRHTDEQITLAFFKQPEYYP
jgi:hypothetical protein